MVAQPIISTRYKVVYEKAAQDWLQTQTEFVQRHVSAAISTAAYNPIAASDHLYRQWIWTDRTHGHEARRIKMTRPKPGIRAICYVLDHERALIVIKLAWRDDDPYEDQG